MNTSISEFDASRRFAMKGGVLVAASMATEAAHAIEPVTTGAVIVGAIKIIGGLLFSAGMLSLANAMERNALQNRSSREPGFHGDTGPNHELKGVHRDKIIPLPDGGVILCGDGLFRPRPPSGSTPGPDSDLSIPELGACYDLAPYPGGPRQQPVEPAAESRRRLDALEGLLKEPLHRMRYVRVMINSKGERRVLRSALTSNRKAEFLTVWDMSGQRLLRAYKPEPWTLVGAKDLA